MVCLKKYGKSLDDIFEIKQSFFENNDSLYKENLKLSEISTNQPLRALCKNCNNKLGDGIDFIKQSIPYKLCDVCNHLNSVHEDTEEFAKAIYVEEVTDYSKSYSAINKEVWLDRVEKIYSPKAKFLKEVLVRENNTNKKVLDLGAGSGYFVKALHQNGFDDSIGYEVSANQVKLSEIMLDGNYINKIDINELLDVITKSNSEIISMIGVLEHLTNPRDILKAIRENNHIKYIYMSVPLFSYTVFWEVLNEDVYNRHLTGGHTHLYTNESIDYLCDEFNFSMTGKWQFGADAMDLFRMNSLKINKKMSGKMQEIYKTKSLEVINSLQQIFDENDFSSEVHVVLKVNK